MSATSIRRVCRCHRRLCPPPASPRYGRRRAPKSTRCTPFAASNPSHRLSSPVTFSPAAVLYTAWTNSTSRRSTSATLAMSTALPSICRRPRGCAGPHPRRSPARGPCTSRFRVGSVKAYLLMIARNLYRDGRRKPVEARLPAVEVRDPGRGRRRQRRLETSCSRPACAPQSSSRSRSPPDGHRGRLSHQAIASALGLSAAAVKVRVHRASEAQRRSRNRSWNDMTVTRSVILDLWPIYASVTRATHARCRRVPARRSSIRATAHPMPPSEALPALPPMLSQASPAPVCVLSPPPIISAASRSDGIVVDTSWDVSPRNFIITALIAAAFWIAFLVSLWRMRARILVVPTR